MVTIENLKDNDLIIVDKGSTELYLSGLNLNNLPNFYIPITLIN